VNISPHHVSSADIVAAYNGDQQALRKMPAGNQRPTIEGAVPNITVTREAALHQREEVSRLNELDEGVLLLVFIGLSVSFDHAHTVPRTLPFLGHSL
jgi:hypothetical protein